MLETIGISKLATNDEISKALELIFPALKFSDGEAVQRENVETKDNEIR